MAIGIRPDSGKEILNYIMAPTESLSIWRELLKEAKIQGVQEGLLFVTDGLVGSDQVMSEEFPKAKQQRCLAHIARNICYKVW